MKFKNDFPKNYEWILNKYLEDSRISKNYGKPTYEFECWIFGNPAETIFKAKDKTASGLAKKINKFLLKLK
jgi:hypothetical protein